MFFTPLIILNESKSSHIFYKGIDDSILVNDALFADTA